MKLLRLSSLTCGLNHGWCKNMPRKKSQENRTRMYQRRQVHDFCKKKKKNNSRHVASYSSSIATGDKAVRLVHILREAHRLNLINSWALIVLLNKT